MEPEIFPNLSKQQIEVLADVLHRHADLYEDAEDSPIFKAMLEELSAKQVEVQKEGYPEYP